METMLVAGTAVLLREGSHGVEVLLIRRPDRGSFAGAWVFPGGLVEVADIRPGATEVENAGRAAVRETLEEVGLEVSGLTGLSRWMPPIEAPKRVRTWFFLANEMHGEITPSPDEVIDWRWMRPTDALTAHVEDEIRLFPPTWVTLHSLATALNVEAALAVASDFQYYSTHILTGLEGQTFVWEGDAEHPAGGSGRHRLETGRRPWTYQRD